MLAGPLERHRSQYGPITGRAKPFRRGCPRSRRRSCSPEKPNKDGGNESGNASQSRRGDVLERFFPNVPVCAHAFTASHQSKFWQPDNPTESNLPSWQRLLLDPRRNKIYQEHLRMLLNGAPNLLISSLSRGASYRQGASYALATLSQVCRQESLMNSGDVPQEELFNSSGSAWMSLKRNCGSNQRQKLIFCFAKIRALS